MLTHFSILFVILFASLFWERRIRYNKKLSFREGSLYDYKGPLMPWLLVFGYLAILAGYRSAMNDTSVYISSFVNQEATWEALKTSLKGDIRYSGTIALTVLFKMFISQDYHIWFLTWAVVESCLFINVLRRESVSFFDACFFFFASTLYYNYFSMMRQWMAVAIMFWGSKYLRDNKVIKFIIVSVIAAIFHTSALVIIPLVFVVNGKAWSGKQLLAIALFSVGMLFLNPLLSGMEVLMDGTTYDYVVETMRTDAGSSIVRAFIAAVPVCLAFTTRRKTKNNPMINICVNMSLMNLLLNVLASATSGLYVIRLATYLSVYNVILYPYLLNVACQGTNRRILKTGFYIIYIALYIYQMSHQGAWGYKSDVLLWLSNY